MIHLFRLKLDTTHNATVAVLDLDADRRTQLINRKIQNRELGKLSAYYMLMLSVFMSCVLGWILIGFVGVSSGYSVNTIYYICISAISTKYLHCDL